MVLGSLLILTGCQGISAKPTVDTPATINAAVQATATAQAQLNATVEALVQATTSAQPTAAPTNTVASSGASQPTSSGTAKTATPKPPTLTPTPSVNYVAMTEEELAALVDQAVQEAVAATTTATTTTTTYTADGSLSAQQVQTLTTYVATAQTEISQALALAQAYYDLYSQVATETLTVLKAIEADLNSMASSMTAMATSLQSISQTMAQGLTLAQSTITQLQSTAQKAYTSAQRAATQAKSWTASVKAELDKLAANALATKPTNVPTDLRGTATSVTAYVDGVRTALSDNKVTKTELNNISQLGANAVAGLNKFGGTQFSGLAGAINNTTTQIARGQTTQAKKSLTNLEQSSRALTNAASGPAGPGAPSGPPRK